MGVGSDQAGDWVVLYWLERTRSACQELHAHLRLLLAVVSGAPTGPAPELLAPDASLALERATLQHHERLAWVMAHLSQLVQPRIDAVSLNELADFDRAVVAHRDAPVSLLLRATTEELSARMRVGTPPPDVFAGLRWETGSNGEWSVGTYLGTMPMALRRYYEELADVDEEHRRVGFDGQP